MFEQRLAEIKTIKQPHLFIFTLVGSFLCWLPGFIRPSLDLPVWLPLILVTLLSGLSATLADGRWLESVLSTSAGTFAGLFVGCAIWPDPDPITRSYSGVLVIGVTLLSIFISVVSGFVGLKISKRAEYRRDVIWMAFVCCAAYGPIALLLTPSFAARRVAHNQDLASERFWALKSAAERTSDGKGSCDERALRESYNGPPFDENAWQLQQIAEKDKYISLQDGGYLFGIWCYQTKQVGYVIYAHPERDKQDGVRQFCTDESKKIGCGVEWRGTRNVCKPCS